LHDTKAAGEADSATARGDGYGSPAVSASSGERQPRQRPAVCRVAANVQRASTPGARGKAPARNSENAQ